MREIVTLEEANRLFLLLAIALPAAGALLGALLGRGRGIGRGAVRGLLIGLLGPANLLLWYVYNGITERLGLDTVRNLLVNLALFLALGVIAGLVAGRYYRPKPPDAAGSNESEAVVLESESPERLNA